MPESEDIELLFIVFAVIAFLGLVVNLVRDQPGRVGTGSDASARRRRLAAQLATSASLTALAADSSGVAAGGDGWGADCGGHGGCDGGGCDGCA
jgi:hypothetical protein